MVLHLVTCRAPIVRDVTRAAEKSVTSVPDFRLDVTFDREAWRTPEKSPTQRVQPTNEEVDAT